MGRREKEDLVDTPSIEAPTDPESVLPEFMTVEEAAKVLRLNRKTVYSMIKRKKLPGARPCGRTYRVHFPTVLEWFQAGSRRVRGRKNG